MKLFHIPTKACTLLFLLGCLALCALLAWHCGAAHGMETVWVAREKIVNAPATVPMEQFSAVKALAAAAPVFLGGVLFTLPLTALYRAALAHLRGEQ